MWVVVCFILGFVLLFFVLAGRLSTMWSLECLAAMGQNPNRLAPSEHSNPHSNRF